MTFILCNQLEKNGSVGERARPRFLKQTAISLVPKEPVLLSVTKRNYNIFRLTPSVYVFHSYSQQK